MSTLLGLGLLEGAARIHAGRLEGPPGSRREPLVAYSADYGWEKVAGERAWLHRAEYQLLVEVNRKGLRGPERPYRKPPGVCRLLLLGDSFVEGYTVPDELTVRGRLESELAADGRRVEVLNAGTHGWSTDQELLYFRNEGRKYAPDLLALFFYYNDLAGNLSTENKPYFELENGQLRLRNVPVPQPPASIDRERSRPFRLKPFRGSYLLRFISNRTAVSNIRLNHALARLGLAEAVEIEDKPPPELQPFRSPHVPQVGEAWRLTRALLAELDREARAVGAQPLLVYVPARFEMSERVWQLTAEQYGMGRKWRSGNVRERLAQLAGELGLPLLDPSDELREAEAGFRPAYLPLDGHWSATGHAVAAAALARYVNRELPGCGRLP